MWAKVLPKKTGEGARRAQTVQFDIGQGQHEKSFATLQEAREFKTKT